MPYKKITYKSGAEDYYKESVNTTQLIIKTMGELARIKEKTWLPVPGKETLALERQLLEAIRATGEIKLAADADEKKFLKAQSYVAQEEQGYSDGRNDPSGGETYKGISRKQNPKWKGWDVIGAYKSKRTHKLGENAFIKNAHLDDMVHDFFRSEYWMKIDGNDIKDQAAATYFYDWYVNAQQGAVDDLNKILFPDGKYPSRYGPETIAAINSDSNLLPELYNARIAFYNRLAGKLPDGTPIPNHKQTIKEEQKEEQSLDGWLNRANELYNKLNKNNTPAHPQSHTSTIHIEKVIGEKVGTRNVYVSATNDITSEQLAALLRAAVNANQLHTA